MSYALNLPPDTRTQVADYLAKIVDRRQYEVVRDAVLDQLTNIARNPKIGTPVYGGPFESRRVYRFTVTAGQAVHDLQMIYRVNDADRVIVISGLEPTPSA